MQTLPLAWRSWPCNWNCPCITGPVESLLAFFIKYSNFFPLPRKRLVWKITPFPCLIFYETSSVISFREASPASASGPDRNMSPAKPHPKEKRVWARTHPLCQSTHPSTGAFFHYITIRLGHLSSFTFIPWFLAFWHSRQKYSSILLRACFLWINDFCVFEDCILTAAVYGCKIKCHSVLCVHCLHSKQAYQGTYKKRLAFFAFSETSLQ